jgi:hypothetical protein
MNETLILIRLLRMYIPRNWEFGSALANLGISGGGVEPPHSLRYATGGEVHTGFWRGNLMETDHLEDPSIDERIILGWILRLWNAGAWN